MTQTVLVVVARWLVAVLFLFSGISKIIDFGGTKSVMVQYGFPFPTFALCGAIGVELVDGTLLGLGASTHTVTVILILYVITASVTILVRQLGEPILRKNALNHLAKNVAVIGALIHLYVDVSLLP